uniref:Uncharacterized protein n=1 Tax=viral metagenome TaxID=1070528 RepID=A0A6C0AEZ2_9ZZZZ
MGTHGTYGFVINGVAYFIYVQFDAYLLYQDLTREMYILILRHGKNLKKCFENINKKCLDNFESEKRHKYEEKAIEDQYTSFIKFVYGKKMYYSDYRRDDVQFIYEVNFDTNLITFETNSGKILKKHKFKDILKLDIEDLETEFNEESESEEYLNWTSNY